MFGRRLSVVSVVCGLLLFGTAHAASAKTCLCMYSPPVTIPHDTPVDIEAYVDFNIGFVAELKIKTAPKHGTAMVTVPENHGTIHYVPDAGFVGSDVFIWSAYESDGSLIGDAEATITVTGPAPTTTTTGPATTTTTVAAMASTLPATTVPTPTTIVTTAALPRTGSASGGLAVLGAGTIITGIAALSLSRRRFERVHR
jgi:LPXTG-motif cell wall-anchored protein